MTTFQKLMLRGALFSLLANGAKLFALWRYHGYTTFIFSDWDEPFYFAIAYEKAAALFGGTLVFHDLYYPHDLLNILLGTLGLLVRIEPSTLGLVSDFACSFFAYILLTHLFSELREQTDYCNEIAALVVCILPWLYPIKWFFPAQPIFRGFNTQYSFVLFVYALHQFFAQQRKTKSSSVRIGILGGSLLYCYFFAWGAFLALSSCYVFWDYLCSKRLGNFQKLRQHFILLCWAFVTSLPGLLFIVYKHFSSAHTGASEEFPVPTNFHPFWFFAPLDIATLSATGIGLFILCHVRKESHRMACKHLVLLLSLFCSHFVLMNFQHFVQFRMEPYHFGLFFFYPIVSGVCISLFFVYGLESSNLRLFGALALCLLAVLTQGREYLYALQENDDEQELSQVFRELKEHTPGSARILSLPYLADKLKTQISPYQMLLPSWIKALSRRSIFIEAIGAEPERDGFLKRELFISWLYRGRLALLTPCPKLESAEVAKDVLEGTGAFEDIARAIQCQRVSRYQTEQTICSLLKSYRADYLLDDRSNRLQDQRDSIPFTEVLWASSKKTYSLLRFRQDEAIQALCTPVVEIQTSG